MIIKKSQKVNKKSEKFENKNVLNFLKCLSFSAPIAKSEDLDDIAKGEEGVAGNAIAAANNSQNKEMTVSAI